MARRCVYCGQSKSSKEHVYPKWLRRVMGEYDKVITVVDTAEGRRVRPTEVPFDITVNTVCRDCNTGWMHDLEDAAMALLKRLIRGEQCELTVDQQGLLARWLCKTVQMMAQQAKSSALIPTEHYQSVFKDRVPPPGTAIWLATQTEPLDGAVSAVYSSIDHLQSTADPQLRVPAEATFYSAGLAIGAFGALLLANADGSITSPLPSSEADAYVVPVWPSTALKVWPPRSSDDLGGVKALYERLFAS